MHARIVGPFEGDRALANAIEQADRNGRELSICALAWSEIIARGIDGLVTVDSTSYGAATVIPCEHPKHPKTGAEIVTWATITKRGDGWEVRGYLESFGKAERSFPEAFSSALLQLDCSAAREVDQ